MVKEGLTSKQWVYDATSPWAAAICQSVAYTPSFVWSCIKEASLDE